MGEGTQSVWSKRARELGQGFAGRVASDDREGRFVEDNYKELKAAKFFSAGVPAELGGGGASHAELCEAIRELAQHCPSTALALSMHTHLVATAVWRHLHGQPAAPLLEKVAKGELVLVSTGANDWLESNGKAVKVDGGYKVTAQKRFASGSPAGNLAITSAPYDDPKEGPQVIHFAAPLGGEGTKVGSDWDTLGMRATGSNTLLFEQAFIPDAAVSMKRPRGAWTPMFEVICTVALPIFSAAYLGAADAAVAIARDMGRKRQSDPHLPYLLGEVENAHHVAQLAWADMVANAAGYDFTPSPARASRAAMGKTVATEAIQRCVSKAVVAVGGSAFFRTSPLEKLWRDVQAMQFHPMQEIRQLHFTGRVAMGLPPQ